MLSPSARPVPLILVVLFGLLGGLGGPVFCDAPGTEEIAALQAIFSAYQAKGDRLPLFNQINQFLARYPQSPSIPQMFYLAGELAFAARDYDRAQKTYQVLIEKWSRSKYTESAKFRLGECQFNQGKFEAAQQTWKDLRSQVAGPLLLEIKLALVQTQVRMQAWDAAEETCADLVSAYPDVQDRNEVRFVRGLLAYHRQNYAEAVNFFNGLQSPQGLYYLGRSLHRANELIRSADAYDQLIRGFPGAKNLLKNAIFEKGELFYALKNPAWARSAYEYFLLNFQGDALRPYASFKLGCIALSDQQPQKAMKYFLPLHGQEPDKGFKQYLDYLRGDCLAKLGEPRQALEAYAEVQAGTSGPFAADVQFRKGWTLFALQDFAGAQKAVEEYLRVFATSPWLMQANFLLGNSLYAQRLFRAATQIYHDAILFYPYSKITDACLMQIQKSYQRSNQPQELISSTGYILKVLEDNFKPEDEFLRAICYFYLGEAYYQVGQYANAIRNYRYITQNLKSPVIFKLALESLAWGYFQNSEFVEAQKTLLQLLADPALPRETRKRGELLQIHCLFNQRRYSQAIKAYQAWIQVNRKDSQVAEALFGLGQSYMRVGQEKKAMAIFSQIVQRYQRDPLAKKTLLIIGHTYFNEQAYPNALKVYRLYLSNFPSDPLVPEIKLRIANTLYNAGDTTKARKAFRDYLSDYPEGQFVSEATNGIELTDWRETDSANTSVQYAQFIRNHPKSEFADLAQYHLALLAFEAKRYEECVQEIRKLNYGYPGSQYLPNAQYYLGLSLEKLGRLPEALKLYEAFVQNYPKHDLVPEVLSRLAEANFQGGHYTDAIKAYALILERFPLQEYAPEAMYNIGVCYQQSKLWSNALETFARFQAKYPKHPKTRQVILNIGVTYHQMARYRQAVPFLQRALELFTQTDRPEILYRLGNSYENLGETQKAAALYHELIKVRPFSNDFRLLGLSQLAAWYEKSQKKAEAIDLYVDIKENSKNTQWRKQAIDRIRELNNQ